MYSGYCPICKKWCNNGVVKDLPFKPMDVDDTADPDDETFCIFYEELDFSRQNSECCAIAYFLRKVAWAFSNDRLDIYVEGGEVNTYEQN